MKKITPQKHFFDEVVIKVLFFSVLISCLLAIANKLKLIWNSIVSGEYRKVLIQGRHYMQKMKRQDMVKKDYFYLVLRGIYRSRGECHGLQRRKISIV